MEGNDLFFEAFDSIQFGIMHITTEHVAEGDGAGDWVMSWNRVTAYQVEVDKSIRVMYHGAFKMEEGKIALMVNFWERDSNYFGASRDRMFIGGYVTYDF